MRSLQHEAELLYGRRTGRIPPPLLERILGAFGDKGPGAFNPKRAGELFLPGGGPANAAQFWLNMVGWRKPKNASMLYFVLQGSGAGGGPGFTNGSTKGKGGGGGGGSGACTRLLIPARFVPDALYLFPANGGPGGTVLSTGGTNGTCSCALARAVNAESDLNFSGNSVANYVLFSGGGNNPAGQSARGGAAAAASGAAAGGAAETPSGIFALYSLLGVWTTIAGQAGAAGGDGSVPSAGGSVAWGAAGLPASGGPGGGAGGSGAAAAGGALTGSGLVQAVPGGAAGVGANAGNGGQGWQSDGVSWSGSGGGGSSTGNGGVGGIGGWGCGGAGGGGGVTFGAGGDGGPGFVYVAWW